MNKEKKQFETDFKSRDILEIVSKKTNDGKIIYTITLGDIKVKNSKFDVIIEKLENLETKVNGIETKVQKIDVIETKVDKLTDAVKELQSEATINGWNINHKIS